MAKSIIVASGMPVDRAPGPGGDEGDQVESMCHAWSQHGRGIESEARDEQKGNRRIAEFPRPANLPQLAPWAKLSGAKPMPAKLREALKGKQR
jgi:hypothetical protein